MACLAMFEGFGLSSKTLKRGMQTVLPYLYVQGLGSIGFRVRVKTTSLINIDYGVFRQVELFH